MTAEDAALYVGRVVHRRARPRRHHLDYRVFSLLIDLDRLETVAAGLRLLSIDRFNVFSLRRGDFGGHDGRSPAAFIRARARQAGVGAEIGQVRMLCYPRLFGFAFNPLIVYYAEDRGGRLAFIVYEVHNTFGERHFYEAAVTPCSDGIVRHAADKAFFVSPFNGIDGRYHFTMQPPDDTVFAGVTLADEQGGLVAAYFQGERRSLTDGMLIKLAVTYPLMTLTIYAGIHWEALKLWSKGVPTTLGLRRMARRRAGAAAAPDHRAARFNSPDRDFPATHRE